jgi:serine/threonine protein kinase
VRLTAGTRIGQYEVTGLIGAGGMGEVYRAVDRTLGRSVAIKVLPETVGDDPDRIARLEREARILASLNHHHIATIHGLERSQGVSALVLELVEGPTLADRLIAGPLPLDDALSIARQVAEALEAAHDQGIVHRDLKPANIKVTGDGVVKVLDFGLAKVAAEDVGPAGSMAPTAMTSPGLVLGTLPYMSPEQAMGRDAERSTDVWAFACVLYEMLTGHRAVDGETPGEILASVLRAEPDWDRLPPETPVSIRRLLRRSLEKDPKQRLRDIRDARIEIRDALNRPSDTTAPLARSSSSGRRIAVLAAFAVSGTILGAVAMTQLRPTAAQPELRLQIPSPPSRSASVAISPDGRQVVFAALSQGQPVLWLRALDALEPQPLRGTERVTSAFWAPDGRRIAFFADFRLKVLDLGNGTIRTLEPTVAAPLGGTWNSDDTILFAPNPGSPVFRISATGGDPVAVTRFEPSHRGHSSPAFLPDGRSFLFYVAGGVDRGVYAGRLDGTAPVRLFDAEGPAVFASAGYLLFGRDGRLFAQRFDPARLVTAGEPFVVAESLPPATTLSVSDSGAIAYRTALNDNGQRQFVWIDRRGTELDRVTYADAASLGPALSPDGRRVAVFRFVNNNMDIWSYERARQAWDRVTVAAGDDISPVWSSDNTRLLFASRRTTAEAGAATTSSMDLYSKVLRAAPGDGEALLLSTPEPKFPTDWSRDGQFVLYNSLSVGGGMDLWALPMADNAQPREVVRTQFNERHGQFSPDGRWIAYQSDRSGRDEVYVRPFSDGGSDIPVSIDGGGQARWNPDGRELFFVAADDWLMSVPIRVTPTGMLEPAAPVRLFRTNVGTTAPNTNAIQYGVLPDGLSFLMNSVVGEVPTSPITVIINWDPRRTQTR